MDTKVLEYILAIEQEKNISRAAEKLFMSQPSLSRHIKNIEDVLDAKLFFRQNNELQLTDAGRIFVNNAQAILHIEQQAMARLEDMRKDQKTKIRLIIGTKERTVFSRQVLPAFGQAYPDVEVILTAGDTNDAREYVLNGIADMGVFTTRSTRQANLGLTLLRNDELMLAMPAGSEAARKIQAHGLHFECMQNDYFILNKDDNDYRQMEQDIFTANRFQPSFLCEVSKFQTALHMVQSGVGNAFLPRSFLRVFGENIKAFSLVPPCSFRLVACMRQDTLPRPPIKKLVQLMADIFSGLAQAETPAETAEASIPAI